MTGISTSHGASPKDAAATTPGDKHMDHPFRSSLLGLFRNFAQFENSVWNGTYRENISISVENLISHTFLMCGQSSCYTDHPDRFAADLVFGFLQAASSPVSVLNVASGGNVGCLAEDENGQKATDGASVAHDENDDSSSAIMKLENEADSKTNITSISDSDVHKIVLTKNIPPYVAYSVRGVRCRYCGEAFRSPTCVKELTNHTKRKHPLKASPKNIRFIEKDCSLENVIGNGMAYCKCRLCRRFGPASLDKTLPPVSLMSPRQPLF